jgi:hypothetical protein
MTELWLMLDVSGLQSRRFRQVDCEALASLAIAAQVFRQRDTHRQNVLGIEHLLLDQRQPMGAWP